MDRIKLENCYEVLDFKHEIVQRIIFKKINVLYQMMQAKGGFNKNFN